MDEFTDQERLEQSWSNLVALLSATSEFLRQRGIDPHELSRFFGEAHAPGWDEARGDLAKTAYYVALNAVTMGMTTETTHGDGSATVVASWTAEHDDPDWPFPVKPLGDELGVSFEPIMAHLGVGYSWEATDEGVTFRLTS